MTGLGPHSEVPTFVSAGPPSPQELTLRCLWTPLYGQLTLGEAFGAFQLGGGGFGNKDEWIRTAMQRALRAVSDFGLDVKFVSYGQPSRMLLDLAQEFG